MSKKTNKTIILPHKTENGEFKYTAFTEKKMFSMPTFLYPQKDKYTHTETNEKGKSVKKTTVKVKLPKTPKKLKNLTDTQKQTAWINTNVGKLINLPLWSKKSDLHFNYDLDNPTRLQRLFKVKKPILKKTALVSMEELERQKLSKKKRKELERKELEAKESEKIPLADQEVVDDTRSVEEIIESAPPPEIKDIELTEEEFKDISEKEALKIEKEETNSHKVEEKEKKYEAKAEKKETKKEQKRQDRIVRKALIGYHLSGIIKSSISRPMRAALISMEAIFISVGGIYIYQDINHYFNNRPYINDNFGEIGDTFDKSDDIETDDRGNIIVNPPTQEEKEILTKLLEDKLLREPSVEKLGITKIDNILSITRFTQNACEDDNEYDKYLVSIIFESEGKLYCKNYVEGSEVENNSFKFDIDTSDKQNMIDFIDYLNKCATDTCTSMSDEQEEVLKALQKEEAKGAIFVGNCIETYAENGEGYFLIPVYIQTETETKVITYSVLQESYKGIIKNVRQANKMFHDLYTGKDTSEIDLQFEKNNISTLQDFAKILDIINSFKEATKSSNLILTHREQSTSSETNENEMQ